MRRGQVVGEAALPCPTERLVEMMFGRVLTEPEPADRPLGEPVLELDRRDARGPSDHDLRALALGPRAARSSGWPAWRGAASARSSAPAPGCCEPSSGSVRVGGRDLTGRGYREFLEAGMHYLPAGRLEEGLVPGLTVAEHFVLTGGDGRFFVDWDDARRSAQDADRATTSSSARRTRPPTRSRAGTSSGCSWR